MNSSEIDPFSLIYAEHLTRQLDSFQGIADSLENNELYAAMLQDINADEMIALFDRDLRRVQKHSSTLIEEMVEEPQEYTEPVSRQQNLDLLG